MHHFDRSVGYPDSALINGRGQRYLVDSGDPDVEAKLTPWPVYNLEPNKRYRFRLSQPGNKMCAFKVSVEQHNITVIAADGIPIIAREVDTFTLMPGNF